jgi:hypothetical protein
MLRAHIRKSIQQEQSAGSRHSQTRAAVKLIFLMVNTTLFRLAMLRMAAIAQQKSKRLRNQATGHGNLPSRRQTDTSADNTKVNGFEYVVQREDNFLRSLPWPFSKRHVKSETLGITPLLI